MRWLKQFNHLKKIGFVVEQFGYEQKYILKGGRAGVNIPENVVVLPENKPVGVENT